MGAQQRAALDEGESGGQHTIWAASFAKSLLLAFSPMRSASSAYTMPEPRLSLACLRELCLRHKSEQCWGQNHRTPWFMAAVDWLCRSMRCRPMDNVTDFVAEHSCQQLS